MGEGNVNQETAVFNNYKPEPITSALDVFADVYKQLFESNFINSATTSNEDQDYKSIPNEESGSGYISDKVITRDENNEMNLNSLKVKINNYESLILNKNFMILDELYQNASPWFEEGVSAPNKHSIDLTKTLLYYLANKRIFTYKISPTIEEGIMLTFKNKFNKLYFELYNDGQIGYIIEDTLAKKILDNKDLNSIPESSLTIQNFLAS